MAEKNNGNAAKGGVTKKEAVRQALSALGMDAPRAELHKFIKEHFDLDVTPNHISSCKGEIQRAKKPKKAATAAKAPAAKQEQPKPSVTHSIRLDDIESVKNLVDRVGADSLRKLIAMLAK